jgi:alkylated DNA repair dioxygenase AlkB
MPIHAPRSVAPWAARDYFCPDIKSNTMSLLFNQNTADRNILPRNGTAFYCGKIFTEEQSDFLLKCLWETIAWKNDELVMFGKAVTTKRKVAWYGDEQHAYKYSGTTKTALLWTPELKKTKEHVEHIAGETFNTCLLNLYHSGEESMGWHSDDEKELKPMGAIASVSFGAERKFVFRHKDTKDTVEIVLEHGSMLVMKNETQSFWAHRLPPTKRITSPRINLTFRTIVS